ITQSIVAGAIEDAVDGLTDPTEIADATATATTIGQATAAGTLNVIAGQVASAIGQPTLTRDDVKANETASPIYYRELIKVIADGQGEGLDSEVDKPKSRDYAPIAGAALPYDTLLTAQITPRVEALIISTTTLESPTTLQKIGAAEGIITESVGASAETVIN